MVGDVNIFLMDGSDEAEEYAALASAADGTLFVPPPHRRYASAAVSSTVKEEESSSGSDGHPHRRCDEPRGTRVAEIMVMIAAPSARRRGFAAEAVTLMMSWGEARTSVANVTRGISVHD